MNLRPLPRALYRFLWQTAREHLALNLAGTFLLLAILLVMLGFAAAFEACRRFLLPVVVVAGAACAAPPVRVPPSDASIDLQAPDVDYPRCPAGPIYIEEDCSQTGAWRCQVPVDLAIVPCAIPNLARWLVADCNECRGAP